MKATVKRLTIGVMIISFALGWPMASMATGVDSIKIIDFGLYKTSFTGWQNAPDTLRGKIQIIGQRELLKRTKKIPVCEGSEFGIRYVVNGQEEGGEVDLLIRVSHSEMQSSEEWVTARQIGTPSFDGWKFDRESQMVPGKVTIELFHEGIKLAEKTFTVY
ncbi:MAG: DUF3859 domain-containing protein [Deltaproteobacteria bacterium]|jgi:hypothetical protein